MGRRAALWAPLHLAAKMFDTVILLQVIFFGVGAECYVQTTSLVAYSFFFVAPGFGLYRDFPSTPFYLLLSTSVDVLVTPHTFRDRVLSSIRWGSLGYASMYYT